MAERDLPHILDADLARHAALGIPAELLEQAGVRRVDDAEVRSLLGLARHHGDLSGVLYPRIHPVQKREQGYRVRRDRPEMEGGRPRNNT